MRSPDGIETLSFPAGHTAHLEHLGWVPVAPAAKARPRTRRAPRPAADEDEEV